MVQKGKTMEKTGQKLELLIKGITAIFGIIAIIFIVRNCISMTGFWFVKDENDVIFYHTLQNTHVGKVYNSLGVINDVNLNVIKLGFVSFITNIDWICYVFLFITILLLIAFFTFPKWEFVGHYLRHSLYLFFAYLSKYMFVLIFLGLFFDGTESSVYLSMKVSTISYFVFSFIEMFILSLWIVKFILNLPYDLKSLFKDC